MEKEKIRDIVASELMINHLQRAFPETMAKLEDSLVEALHQALSMSGVVVSPCDHSNTYPLNQKYSKCRKCGGCIED